jgi:hypothetical protein
MEKDGFAKMILEKNISSEKIIEVIRSPEFINKVKINYCNYKNEDASKIINIEIMKEVKK